MKHFLLIPALLLLSSIASAQTYVAGVQVATVTSPTSAVTYVTPTPSTLVMQCATATFSCWPTIAGTVGASVALGSIPNGEVFAIVPPATTGAVVTVASITAAPVTPVTPVAPVTTTGTAVLTWTAPTTDTNGLPLATTTGDALTGFNIYQGTTAANVAKVGSVAAITASTSYTIAGLAAGTYVFTVTAVNSFGESAQATDVTSTIVTSTIQPSGSTPASPTSFTVTVTVSVPTP